jgi:hypothetical protein
MEKKPNNIHIAYAIYLEDVLACVERPKRLGVLFISKQCPGRFLDIIGQDLSVSKSNQPHVDIVQIIIFI